MATAFAVTVVVSAAAFTSATVAVVSVTSATAARMNIFAMQAFSEFLLGG
ncbi:MAG: hypothetical protein IJ940_08930 [Bacteroidales bacterium]|nr:hypothetical protein [Bacteroidales bacterium]